MAKTDKTKTDEVETSTFVPKIVKRITLPTLKLVPNIAVYVKITDPIFQAKEQKPKIDKDGKKEAPMKAPMLFNVTNLETGEEMQLVAGAVVESEITENYPKDSYVGLCFMIVKGKKKDLTGGRSYYTYSISQIEDPAA